MMLPCSTNRESVTSFSMRLFTLVAMALVAAGGRNYEVNDEKEHHGKLALISLDGDALQEKINYMGFEGNNSSWETAERGSMALGCEGAQWMEAGDELRVHCREACEKRECDHVDVKFEASWTWRTRTVSMPLKKLKELMRIVCLASSAECLLRSHAGSPWATSPM